MAHHFPLAGERTLVADIGGGSLELIGAVDGLVELTLSLPLGAVRLTELYLPGDGARTRRSRRSASTSGSSSSAGSPGREWASAAVIGSGGTFTNLGRMVAGPPRARRRASRSTASRSDRRGGAAARVARSRTPEQRRKVPGLNPERADIILAGLAVTAELLDWVRTRGASP